MPDPSKTVAGLYRMARQLLRSRANSDHPWDNDTEGMQQLGFMIPDCIGHDGGLRFRQEPFQPYQDHSSRNTIQTKDQLAEVLISR